MSSWLNILQGAVLLAAGAALCYFLIWWKDRNVKKARHAEADALLTQARSDAELMIRDARLAAAEEARKLRQDVEQSFAARRLERMELEKRLTEREGLINSQLQRILESEKNLNDQRAAFRQCS